MRSNMNMFKIMVTLCICTFVFAVDGSKMKKKGVSHRGEIEKNNVIDKPKSVGVSIEGINIHLNNIDQAQSQILDELSKNNYEGSKMATEKPNPNAEKVSANSYDQGQLEYKKVILYLAGDDQELINKINNSTFEAQEEGMEKEEEDSRNPGCPMDGGYGYYGSDNLPADCLTSYTTSCQWGGEIHTSTVVSGNTYTYSTCNGGWDSQLTLYDAAGNELAYSDDACGAQSEIVWESTIDGDVYLEIDKYYCADYNSCIQLDVSCTAPAPSTDVKFTLHDQYDDAFEGFLSFNGIDMTDAAGGGDSEYSFSLDDGAYNYTYTCNQYCNEHSWTVTAGATVLGSGSGSDGLTNYSFNVGGPPPVPGCTDASAENFDATADLDDGTCTWNGGCSSASYCACDNGDCKPCSYFCDGSNEYGNAGWGPDCSDGSDEGADCCGIGDATYPETVCVADCNGDMLGDAELDCASTCGGSATLDDCGVCAGDGSSCACDDLSVTMTDSYGDSWNGNVLTIGTWSGANENLDGVNGEESQTVTACIDLTVANDVTCGGGSFMGEVSWSIADAAGTVLLAGGAPYAGCIGAGCPVYGCMDSAAPQYNADATLEDGSCAYPGQDCEYFGYDAGLYYLDCDSWYCIPQGWLGDGGCDGYFGCNELGCDGGDCGSDCLGDCLGSAVIDCAGICDGSSAYDDCGVCDGDGSSCACDDMTVEGCDSYGDGWDGASLTIGTWSWGGPASTGGGNVASCETTTACVDLTVANTITMGGGNYAGEHSWSISDAAGNELAAGGDPYGGCIGTGCPVYGCLLAGADNYNPFADLDDGSCNPWPGAEVSYWNSNYPGSFWDCNLAYYLYDNDDNGIADTAEDGVCDNNPAPYEDGYGANTACAAFGCDGGECEDCVGDCLGSAMLDACGTCNGDCAEFGGGTAVITGAGCTSSTTYFDSGNYVFNGYDSWGDGWNGGVATISLSDGTVLATFDLPSGAWGAVAFTVDPGADVTISVAGSSYCSEITWEAVDTGTISCADPSGDTNDDGETNVTDIVLLVSSILGTASLDDCEFAASDLTGDGTVNVLDVIGIIDIILGGGTARMNVEVPSTIEFIKSSNGLSYKADVDGLVGFEMTIRHSSGFELNLSKNAYIADAKTTGDLTKIVVVNAGGTELFTSNGDFEIVEVLAGTANGAIESSVSIIPEVFGLSSAYPNPFNPTTSLELSVPMNGQVTVQVYNLMGQVVATLANGYMDASTYTLTWDASNVSSGMYIVKAEAAGTVSTQKLMLMK